jgi:hypothetical protein
LVVRAQVCVLAKVVFVERFAPISLPPPSPPSREEEEVGEEATTVKVTIIIISFSTTRNRDNNNIDTESYGTIKFVHRRRLLQITMLVTTTT